MQRAPSSPPSRQKAVDFVPIPPPPEAQRACRGAGFAPEGRKRTRYDLPESLESSSPIGYRTRISLSVEEARAALGLLSLPRPEAFVGGGLPTEPELFEELSLGLISARQSTNFRGHRQVTLGPADSTRAAALLQRLDAREGPVLEGARLTHVGLNRPYRTLFTWFLTFVGHRPLASMATVPWRALDKWRNTTVDIPTISYLEDLHVGIWADAMERAAVLASGGRRQANVFMRPFVGPQTRARNAVVIRELEDLVGLTPAERKAGWRVACVAQVGEVARPVEVSPELCRKLGANLLAFRSERIQPGINADGTAPACYQSRQDMNIPERLAEMIGRASTNAMAHWTGLDRQEAGRLLLLERVDVLTDAGKQRIRALRTELSDISDDVVAGLPLWADLPMGRQLSKAARQARKAFALAGQRIYIGGFDPADAEAAGLEPAQAIRCIGAAAARASLTVELCGATEIPEGCDMLGGICMMAGPVNQNDIGKQFYGYPDLLAAAFPEKRPTSLLVVTMKAKTVADPIGNEQQLLDPARKGALVDLRPGPHEVVDLLVEGQRRPFRREGEAVSRERAFADQDNFVRAADGREIPGNGGEAWAGPEALPWA